MFESRHHGAGLLVLEGSLLGLGRRNRSDRAEKTTVIVPVRPFQGCTFNGLSEWCTRPLCFAGRRSCRACSRASRTKLVDDEKNFQAYASVKKEPVQYRCNFP